MAAVSIGRRNTGVESLCRRFKSQRLARALVEPSRDVVQVFLRVYRQIRSLRKILSQQPIGVLIGSALPGASRVAEIDLDVRRQAKRLVIGELLAAIPCQRLVELSGQLLRLLNECVDDGLGVPTGHLRQHHVTGVTLDQGGHVRVLRASDQVSLPSDRVPPDPVPRLDAHESRPYRGSGRAARCALRHFESGGSRAWSEGGAAALC